MRRIANIALAAFAAGIYGFIAYGISGEPPKSFGDHMLILITYLIAFHAAKNDAWN